MQEVKVRIRDAGQTGNKPLTELLRELTTNYAPELAERWEDILQVGSGKERAVRCRVAGVTVGGRDLNWERIPLAEGRPWV